MRRALVMVVLAAGCGSSSEPDVAPPARELPLAATVVPVADAPQAVSVVTIAPNGTVTTASTVPNTWLKHPSDAGVSTDRTQLLEAARAGDFTSAPQLKRGELTGVAVIPIAELEAGPLVLAAPDAPALELVRIAKHSGALLAASRGDRTGMFELAFGRGANQGYEDGLGWVELSSDGNALAVYDVKTGVTHVLPLSSGIVDSDALVRALAETPRTHTLDILVTRALTIQQLVDVLTAARSARRHAIQLVEFTENLDQRRLAQASELGPHVSIGQPNAQGDLDKAEIRKVIKTATDSLLRCYTSAFDATPGLRGTVSAQFVINGDGTVKNSAASGVAPVVASCVAGVIQRLTFPHPKGGGIVQVNYPFAFRSGM